MKKVLIGCGSAALAIIVGIALLVSVVFYATSGIVETADSFFQAVAAEDMNGASELLADEFRAVTSAEELEAFLDQSNLNDYASASWSNRQIENASGTLEGTITTKAGGMVPITMTFVKKGDDWKILSINKPASGLQESGVQESGPATNSVADQVEQPSNTECAELVTATTMAFAEAVNGKDLKSFHDTTSTPFQEQVPLEKFEELFGTFVEQEIDLTPIENFEPIFTKPPGMTAEGVLVLEGYYATEPSQVSFNYKLFSEADVWKVLGINIQVGE